MGKKNLHDSFCAFLEKKYCFSLVQKVNFDIFNLNTISKFRIGHQKPTKITPSLWIMTIYTIT